MLIATALTLMLVAALAQAFSVVGTGVANNRAALEMAGQLRAVSDRLQEDLSGCTAPTLPWPDPSEGLGYFEFVDGPGHDGSRFLLTASNTNFGDVDDVLMFTARGEGDGFIGLRTTVSGGITTVTSIESSLAEIIWFTTHTDTNGDLALSPNEFEDYTLYRRALLIRPDLGTVAVFPSSTSTYSITSQSDLRSLYDNLRRFFSRNDLSVRIVTQLSGNNLRVSLVCNTLGDLTKRENRFAHRRVVAQDTASPPDLRYFPSVFPHELDRDFTSATSLPVVRQPFPLSPQFYEPGAIKTGDYQGEDVMLPHLLAFDLRAYDPLAMIAAHPGDDGGWGVSGVDDDGLNGTDDSGEAGWANSDDEPLIPGDPGFGLTSSIGTNRVQISSSPASVNQVGQGAFVDLNYATKNGYDLLTVVTNPGWSHFSGGVVARSQLSTATYDTWSFHYEYDGINQDQDAHDGAGDSTPPWEILVDEGTDGLDSPIPPTSFLASLTMPPPGHLPLRFANGVDDVGERETSPPYSLPLRAIQVRIRMIDHSSRQVRQATVESTFVPN